jgi:hypothetical protein
MLGLNISPPFYFTLPKTVFSTGKGRILGNFALRHFLNNLAYFGELQRRLREENDAIATRFLINSSAALPFIL